MFFDNCSHCCRLRSFWRQLQAPFKIHGSFFELVVKVEGHKERERMHSLVLDLVLTLDIKSFRDATTYEEMAIEALRVG